MVHQGNETRRPRGGPRIFTSPKALQDHERQRRAYQMRMEGKTWDTIAETLQYSNVPNAIRSVRAFVSNLAAMDPGTAEERRRQVDRLDAVVERYWSAATQRHGGIQEGVCMHCGETTYVSIEDDPRIHISEDAAARTMIKAVVEQSKLLGLQVIKVEQLNRTELTIDFAEGHRAMLRDVLRQYEEPPIEIPEAAEADILGSTGSTVPDEAAHLIARRRGDDTSPEAAARAWEMP